MLRKLLLPLAAAGLLGGCATGDYAYRGGAGDYYYGRPQVEYRYYGSPYGYHPYGSHYGFGLSGYYGHPYYRHPFYGYPHHGYPYYGYPYRPPIVVQPRPDDGGTARPGREDRPPPWRDLNARRRMNPEPDGAMRPPVAPARPIREPRSNDGGSRMEQMMRRSRENARPRVSTEEQ